MTIEEGVDAGGDDRPDFDPDVRVGDGEVAAMGVGWTMRARAHARAHLQPHVLRPRRGAGAVHRRPRHGLEHDGGVAARRRHARLHRLAAQGDGRDDATLWPTHGAPVTSPQPFLQAYLDHRLEREAQVLGRCDPVTIRDRGDMVERALRRRREELHKAGGGAACCPT